MIGRVASCAGLLLLALAGVGGVAAVASAQAPAPEVPTRAPPFEPAQSIAIFVLSGEEVGTPISELYAAARRGIETETALEVAPLEVFPASVREAAIRQCAGDGRCFADRVRQAGV